MTELRSYYPEIEPFETGMLDVGDGHQVYWERVGRKGGKPAVFLHGGPGGGCSPNLRRCFDPSKYDVILFDQRGCGRSTPRGCLDANSLQHSIADMESLRRHLGIERWIVSGGSWGSTVALAYAEAHPSRCLGLFLVSPWLCRKEDTDWWFFGVRTLFPELWDAFAAIVPEAERGDLRTAYCRRILGDDPDVAARFATSLFLYEEGFMHFDAPIAPPDPGRGADYGRIFAHYAAHDFFTDDDGLLRNADRLDAMPVSIITGRYDCCTPPSNAWTLARHLPHAQLEIVPGAGHYPTEPAFGHAIARAAQDFVELIERNLSQ